MKKLLLPIVLFAALLFSGCARPTYGEELKSGKPRLPPSAPATDVSELVAGNTEFALALYQLLKAEDGNIFYSPYSISAALAMTYGGARGETERQMADTLRFTLGQSRLHAAFNALDTALNSRGQGAKGKDDEPFVLKVVNALWGQRDFKFETSYLDLLAENYGAGLRLVDFIKDTENSRQTINNWVAKETEQRIKDLLPQGSVNDLTRLVLTNAVYFNGGWLNPFSEDATRGGAFNLLDGRKVIVPMMFQSSGMGYAVGEGYQAVELKYDGGELSMVIILPAEGAFGAFENSLGSAKLASILAALKNNTVNLTMPKFEFDSEFGLKETLAALGMPVAFSDSADFSGMTGRRDLQIQDVVHKSFISVDEAGTEAAAATGVVVGTTSVPLDPATVTLDRPFIFLIRDIASGALIFTGRVVDPS
ncbi:serpin family protein [Dehalogenimonas alkenigignens]|uniref:serpin family protein n=1 Tax=Dehalogenimonas alkenigignens TaxID=1217799 RepID=UPI000D57D336|nr:serpin family protein [Dehalogenimonas alkenigignens]PVV82721.1 serpin family protein [Dehalogenimonas alkenigignens]